MLLVCLQAYTQRHYTTRIFVFPICSLVVKKWLKLFNFKTMIFHLVTHFSRLLCYWFISFCAIYSNLMGETTNVQMVFGGKSLIREKWIPGEMILKWKRCFGFCELKIRKVINGYIVMVEYFVALFCWPARCQVLKTPIKTLRLYPRKRFSFFSFLHN